MSRPPTESGSRKQEMFLQALELENAAARDAFLVAACGSDHKLRASVEALLRHHRADSFLEQPAVATEAGRTAIIAPPVEMPGDSIGRFKLLEKIGEGGCGVVYMAEQEEPVRRRVALKVIKQGMDTKSVIARFEAERQALAMMDHPNIAKVHDGGVTDTGRPFFVMELVRGIRITDHCRDHALNTRDRLDLFIAVCSAIQHAHQKGIIHRDLKPSNILVTEIDGKPVPKVIDFGIAKATEQKLTDKTFFTQFAQFIGTPAYMSPEQAAMTGTDIDTRSDIYALGVLLYELLTGTTPFDAQELLNAGFDEMRRIIRETEPPRPSTRLTQLRTATHSSVVTRHSSLPPDHLSLVTRHSSLPTDLDWIVMKCLEKDRTRRYESASGLAADIGRHLDNEPVTACPPSAAYRFRKMLRRNRIAVAAAGAVFASLLVGLGISTWMFVRERRARERAVTAEKDQAQSRLLAETQEKVATTEAGRSRQIARFLTEMVEGVGPSVALGDDTKMLRKILDSTAGRVGEELKEQPDVEADLRNIIGNVYGALGEHVKAGEMHAEVLAIRRKMPGDGDRRLAVALNNLAGDLADQGKPAEAETLYREALTLRGKMSGHDPADDATTLGNLATVLSDQGKLDEAETLLREALKQERTLKGNQHSSVATTLSNLSLILQSQGKLAEAEAIQREALAMKRSLFGSEHPAVATSLNNLAPVLLQQRKFAEAETTQREALTMKRKFLGDEHPEVATAMLNLAHSLRRQLKLAESEAMYRGALAMNRKLLGDAHPNTGASLNGLALSLHFQGKDGEAEALLREVEALLRKAVGNEHPDLAQVIDNLAIILKSQGKFAESESVQREALAMSRKSLGHGHPHTITALNNLVSLLQTQGKLAEANEVLRDDLVLARASASDDPPGSERRLYAIADALYRLGEYAGAEPLYRELIASRKGRLGAEHDDVLGPVASLARLLADRAWTERTAISKVGSRGSETTARARESERLLRDCLAIRLRGDTATDSRTDDVRSRLGGALLALAVTDPALTDEARAEKFTEAEALLLEGNEALQKAAQSNSRSYQRDALTRLVRLYTAWEKPGQADGWQQKLDEFDKAGADPETSTVPRKP